MNKVRVRLSKKVALIEVAWLLSLIALSWDWASSQYCQPEGFQLLGCRASTGFQPQDALFIFIAVTLTVYLVYLTVRQRT